MPYFKFIVLSPSVTTEKMVTTGSVIFAFYKKKKYHDYLTRGNEREQNQYFEVPQ